MKSALTFVPSFFASASVAGQAMKEYIAPTIITLCALASLIAVGLLVNGGLQLMASSGKPEKLEHAKLVIRNALIGLVIVLAAGTMTSILSNAYTNNNKTVVKEMPVLSEVKTDKSSDGLVEVLINAITGLLRSIVETAAKPFIGALNYFTKATPLMAENASVFNLWLAIVAITDVLFVLMVILLGFHIMSFATFGLEEIEFKHLIPQLVMIFLLINTSIFAIDGVITISNGMIDALVKGFGNNHVWDSLSKVATESKDLKLAALLVFIVFMILTVMLLIYYIIRLVTLYVGAVLSPLVFLLWLLPSFKDFAENAIKTYLSTIFVLFIHVVILILAASILVGMNQSDPSRALDPIMSMIVGIAVLLSLLKTQAILSQLSYASAGARTSRKLGGQFINGVSHLASRSSSKTMRTAPNTTVIQYKGVKQ
jgi:Type IV secretion system pilin